jgi:hypothetical protein
VRLTKRVLNLTLLRRQHLLERADATVPDMVEHLVGLQAQAPLPPYLSLAARLEAFDPYDVTRGLEDRSLVRLLSLRSTVHLLMADDALRIRQWTRPVHERERRISQNTADARHLAPGDVRATLRDLLADGPLPLGRLGDRLAERLPGIPAAQLTGVARVDAPLAQLPPRGTWKRSGGVVYDFVDSWVGRPLSEPDVPALVRRYLRAFGPASAADVTAWSGVTGMVPVLKAMDDLEVHEDEDGKRLFDVPGGVLEDPAAPAPVRLLGLYDNVWLSHAGRDRVTAPEKRRLWMGVNGGSNCTIFVDGMLEGLWRVVDDEPEVVTLYRPLTRAERSGLDDELDRVRDLLSR